MPKLSRPSMLVVTGTLLVAAALALVLAKARSWADLVSLAAYLALLVAWLTVELQKD